MTSLSPLRSPTSTRALRPQGPLLAMAVAAAVVALLTGMGCGEKLDPVQHVDAAGPEVTWCADIAPFVSGSCLQCHSATLSGPDRNGAPVGVNFDTYEDASRLANAMQERIGAGTMPPDGPLPEADRATFSAWVAQGRPEGTCP